MHLTRRRFLRNVAAATAASAVRSASAGPAKRTRRPRNVVFICLDTVRADHLGCYGYDRGTSPNLDRLAERSVVFDDVLSPSSWTLPVLASAMTGLYPHEHGGLYFRTPIRDGTEHLAQMLGREGIRSAAIGQFPFGFDFYRFQNGFDLYDQKWSMLAPKTTGQIVRWLREVRDDRKGLFLWAHYFEPHMPYQMQVDSVGFYDPTYRGKLYQVFDPNLYLKAMADDTPKGRGERRRILELYDGEIFCADKYLGRILDELARLDMADETMIIVTADHGEHFGEHGIVEHGNTLYEELVRVPLVIHAPGCRPGRCKQLVSLVDLVPTILDFLQLPARQLSGCSLLPALAGGSPPARTLFSTLDTVSSVIFVPDGRDPSKIETRDKTIHNMKVVRSGTRKLIYNAKDRTYAMYDLAADPREQRNLITDGKPPADLAKQLGDWLFAMERYTPTVASPNKDVLEAMRSLGYIQ